MDQENQSGASAGNEMTKRPLAVTTVVVVALLASIASSVMSTYIYHRKFAPKIAAIDVKGFVDRQREDFVANRIDEEGLKKNMMKLDAALQAVPDDTIVLMGDVVVKNVDIIEP